MSLPDPVKALLHRYVGVFQTSLELPPSCFCDHVIPMVEGTRSVNIRPYRLSPTMKTKLQSQVTNMTCNGLIRPSSSSFSSPVLLVKKKHNTWCFCMDYRHLNSLTLKSKYLIPIIDELLDELYGASWFSILDLRAGFHQILLKEW